MRRTPPAATTASPWAATILPAAEPRRPSRFSRPDRTPAEQPEPSPAELAQPVSPPPAAFVAPLPPAPAPMPAQLPAAPAQVNRFGIAVDSTSASGYPSTTSAPGGYPPAAAWTGAPGFGAPGGPASWTPPPAGQSWTPPPAAQGWPTAAKVAIGVVAGGVALSIVAAIAIPVALNHTRPADRPVTVPASLLGAPQLHDPTLDEASNALINDFDQAGGSWSTPVGAYFGQDSVPQFYVAAAKVTVRPTAHDETKFFADLRTQIAVVPEGSGPFGGQMECGPMSSGGVSYVACTSLDSAALVEAVIFGSTTNSEAALLARQIINAVEGGPSLGSIGSSAL